MKQLLDRLESNFDAIIIDAPPLLPVTDAAVLSQHVGGVVVVVGSQKLRIHELERSLGALSMVGSNVLGLVLNRLPGKGPDAYSYSYYSNTSGARDRVDKPNANATRNGRSAQRQSLIDHGFDQVLSDSGARPARAFRSNRTDEVGLDSRS
jgi:Mrp family chromosome partitioning ATPase